jgi:hypothetical protein
MRYANCGNYALPVICRDHRSKTSGQSQKSIDGSLGWRTPIKKEGEIHMRKIIAGILMLVILIPAISVYAAKDKFRYEAFVKHL